jgi:hypothetical protein
MIRLRLKSADRFISVPIAFYLQTVWIQSPASIAMARVILVIILKCFLLHDHSMNNIYQWIQTLIIDLLRLYFRLILYGLDISDLTTLVRRPTAEYVRLNSSPFSLLLHNPDPLKK